ncbi:MAG TPA: Asd/ArgC dimerization domain-containing protein [Thermoanaerobaculia bacterium]|jgi:aspartate-semialdehyde dehydrogenase|nr:Asd/ArgC dimerization domain-containing protein [Thermoanaerobaculia bacterium]
MAHPKSPAGYRLGIVNPLTLVGNEVKSILRERAFPYAKLALLDSIGEGAGALTEVDESPAVVAPIAQEGLDDLDLVFFCGPAAVNQPWIARQAEDDFIAIDLSQATMSEDGKLVVAGVNLEDVQAGEDLLVSPHPIVIPIALILKQIATLSAIDTCTATVIQPASAFEQPGIEELAKQTISVLNIESMPKEVFDRQLAFNLYPAAEHNEELIVSQVRTLTGSRAELALLVTQGTIFHGYTVSLFVKTREPLERDRIMEALAANPAIVLQEGDQQFGTIDAAGKDEVLVAEVRPDASIRGGFWVWAVCDNLRRSSALNAVLVAEKALFGAGATN